MPDIKTLDIVQRIFDNKSDIDTNSTERLVTDLLSGTDDGELFQEYSISENIVFDDGNIKNASKDISKGFGLRAIMGDSTAYAHSSEMDKAALVKAGKTVSAVKSGYEGSTNISKGVNRSKNAPLYCNDNILDDFSFSQKIELLQKIDTYLRSKDNRVKQVSASISGEWQAIQIIRNNGFRTADIRPLIRLNVSVIVEQDGRMERGSYGGGGRYSYHSFFDEKTWKNSADMALKQAVVNLDAIAVKAGEMDIVLSPGWPGIILHEAIGHGLEGDCNRKKTSAFSELMGKQIATKEVTVVDDGTLEGRRGSLNIDDEGTETECTTLIENGILTSYMHDRQNADLMGHKYTGNGRRESYEYQPIPRMTNTYMLNGNADPDQIMSSVKDGLYAVSFGGGQVDTTSGKFVFSASEAYKIENGKIQYPVKGATLIGNGPDVLKKIRAIGNDFALDGGIGTCGKDGQGVPVGVGQPTLLISDITVGGTEF